MPAAEYTARGRDHATFHLSLLNRCAYLGLGNGSDFQFITIDTQPCEPIKPPWILSWGLILWPDLPHVGKGVLANGGQEKMILPFFREAGCHGSWRHAFLITLL